MVLLALACWSDRTSGADVSATWNADASGRWSEGANWTGGVVPVGPTGVATFGNPISDDRTVTVDVTPWSLNSLIFANSDPHTWTLAGGPLNLTGGTPVMAINGGTLVVSGHLSAKGHCYIGSGVTGTGSLIVSEGATVELGGRDYWLNIGGKRADGSGSGGIGVLDINGGSVSVVPGTTWYFNPYGGGGPGELNLNGGSLTVADVLTDGAGSGSKFNFNGGTLRFAAKMSTICNGTMSLNILPGGAIFDTGTNDVTVGPGTSTYPLVSGADGADGGLVKLGSGTLTLPEDNTYNGLTIVSNGTLVVGSLSGGGAVTVKPGAKLAAVSRIAGPLTLQSGASLSVLAGPDGRLSLEGGLTLNDGDSLNFELGQTANPIALAGAFVQNGSATIGISPTGGFTVGTYELITGAPGLSLAHFSLSSTVSGYSLTLTQPNAGSLALVVTSQAPATAFWHNRSGTLWTAASNWDTGASSGVAVSAPPASPTSVTFAADAASAFDTTLGADFSINSLTFASPKAASIGGANALSIGSGITVAPGAGNASVTTHTLKALANQTWTLSDADTTLRIASALEGPGSLTVAGLGKMSLEGASTNTLGGAIFDATTLELRSGAALICRGPVGAVAGGALSISGSLNASGHFYIGSGYEGSATVDINPGATVKLGGQGLWVNIGGKFFNGQGSIGNGTLNINGGTVSVAAGTQWYFNPYGAAGPSTLNLNGGTLVMGEVITDGAGSGSTFNLNGGVLRFPGNTLQICNGTMSLNVLAGGAVIDTAANNVTFGPGTSHYPLVGDPSGSDGGLTKLGSGTLTLPEDNPYNGPTIVAEGTLRLANSTGSGTGSGPVTVRNGATLAGGGILGGRVTVEAGGTLSPGTSVGTLTINNDLTLAGNLLAEVRKSATSTSDRIEVSGALRNNGTGTVTVTNLGTTALAVGDRFHLFSRPLIGGQAMIVSPPPGPGLAWTNNLALDGSVAVVAGAVLSPVRNLTLQISGPSSVTLSGLGDPNRTYGVYASTSLTVPMAAWSQLGTATANAGGAVQFLDAHATDQARFYRFGP